MNRYAIKRENGWMYAIVNGEVYCNEKCFDYLFSVVDKCNYEVICILCGQKGDEIKCKNVCSSEDMIPCTLEYHIIDIE